MQRLAVAVLAAVLLAGCTYGGQQPEKGPTPRHHAPEPQEADNMTELTLSSPAFGDGERIPEKYGYTEQNINPPLEISGVPEEAESLVLVMDDPDAVEPAGKVWDHWVLYDISPNTTIIREQQSPGVEGATDYGEIGYGGPNPPDGEHTYVFTLYALDTKLGLEEGATKEEVENTIEGHVLDEAVLRGTYAP